LPAIGGISGSNNHSNSRICLKIALALTVAIDYAQRQR
jgi:hypothetical protein